MQSLNNFYLEGFSYLMLQLSSTKNCLMAKVEFI